MFNTCKIVAGGLLAVFLLASCASFEADTLQQRAFAAGADFNGVLSLAVEYESLPRCPEGVGSDEAACSEVDIVDALRDAAIKAEAAIEAAEITARTPGATEFTLLFYIAAARNAVSALEIILLTKDQYNG